MLELIPTILGVLFVVSAVTAFIMRRNWLESKALLTDTTIRYEAALQQFQRADQGTKAQKEQIEKYRQIALKAEKSLEDVKNRSSDGKLEIMRLKTEIEGLQAKHQTQKDHLLEQITVLTSQLSENVKEKKSALEEANALKNNMEERARELSEGLRAQLQETQQKLSEMKREKEKAIAQLEKFKSETGLVKPEELRRWQLKLARTEQLYASMKGLREMAEERNENWETALRFFAAHILGKDANKLESTSIGALVGEALEKIGATLVKDDEEVSPPYQAKASTTISESLS